MSVLLRLSRAAVPARVTAALEVESGLNDPMSVFLTVGLVEVLTAPEGLTATSAGLLFLKEMGGGAIIGLASGYALLWLFRRLKTDRSVFPVVAVGGTLAIFGGAQVIGASGFLAVYLAGVIIGNYEHSAREPVTRFFGALGWLAQIALFLMLGLLVTPHQLPPLVAPALALAVVLILAAPGRGRSLSAAVSMERAGDALYRLGRPAWGRADLPHHHPLARRYPQRAGHLQHRVRGGDRIGRGAGVDHLAGCPAAEAQSFGLITNRHHVRR